MFKLLIWRKAKSLENAVRHLSRWELIRNIAFVAVGLWMLYGIYCGFWRLLKFLNSVEIIGDLLIWKLTALAMMTTFSMVVISSLIISLTTLFYSFDLQFLMRSPLKVRAIFLDKCLESAFFSSWMIGLVLFPLIAALARVKGLHWPFYASFVGLMIPYLMLAAVIGIAFTLALMYCFPSPRTRDVIWILSSFSIAIVYVLLRFAQPEKLVRPDALQIVAQYLGYLQAPIAPYLPSWWLTRALWGVANGAPGAALKFGGLLLAGAVICYAAVLYAAGFIYAESYSGAQEGRRARRNLVIDRLSEARAFSAFGVPDIVSGLFWKERNCFFRDVTHWSQIVLVVALMCVYLFSIRRLPLDTPDLKSLISFLNLAIAGFVLSSLGLRFTFPSVSMEGRSFWVIRASPIRLGSLMFQKFIFSVIPMTALSLILILLSNHYLQADTFIAWTTLITIIIMTWTLCAMGVGFGAMFPRFDYSNIHQVESSAGGFVYMAASLLYIGLVVAIEAVPVQMHFQVRFGRMDAWSRPVLFACGLLVTGVSLAASGIPWWAGRRRLERFEDY